jgi:hypothetical protein
VESESHGLLRMEEKRSERPEREDARSPVQGTIPGAPTKAGDAWCANGSPPEVGLKPWVNPNKFSPHKKIYTDALSKALKFGRRPVYPFSSVLSCVSQIIASSAKDKATFNGARIILGFAASPFEQLPAMTINDQFFIHPQGFGLSLYILGLSLDLTSVQWLRGSFLKV